MFNHKKRLALFVMFILFCGLANGQLIDPTRNFVLVTVSTGYDLSATSITLTSGGGSLLPNPATEGSFNLVWYDKALGTMGDNSREIVRCTARSGDVLTVVRGQEGTSPANHNTAGRTYYMIQTATAKTFSDIGNRLSTAGNAYLLLSPDSTNVTVAGMTPATHTVVVTWNTDKPVFGIPRVIVRSGFFTVTSSYTEASDSLQFAYLVNIK